jgi:hypothetical protein
MPDHKIHTILDYMIFGESFELIHDILDSAQPFLQSNHRMMFHDAETVNDIYETMGEKYARAATAHIILDNISDRVGQEKAVPVMLEMMNRGLIVI